MMLLIMQFPPASCHLISHTKIFSSSLCSQTPRMYIIVKFLCYSSALLLLCYFVWTLSIARYLKLHKHLKHSKLKF
jgi:hypothetical protein